jgi:hypothetical protein
MSALAYYRALVNAPSITIQHVAGTAVLIPPRVVPPEAVDFHAMDTLVLSGKLQDYRYIEVKPQPIFLASVGHTGDS